MNREEEKKNAGGDESHVSQPNNASTPGQRQEDNDQHSYPGKLDQVEGRMNNGETGGGLTKEEDN